MEHGTRRKKHSRRNSSDRAILDEYVTNMESRRSSIIESVERSRHPKPEGWGTRHTMALFGFLGFLVSYAMRVNLSLAIVSMVKHNATGIVGRPVLETCSELIPNTTTPSPLLLKAPTNTMSGDPDGEFDWDAEDQGIILGAFFWGYVLTQVPGGILAEKIGGKWPFGIGMLVTAIFSLATPIAARTGKGALVAVRIIQGFGEGVTNPSMHELLSRWLPPLERTKLGAFIYAGMQMGTVFAMPISGYLIGSNILGGWPSVFYVFGTMGIMWFIGWSIFVYDTPAKHPRIEAKELSYIQHCIGGEASSNNKTPWRKILTSMPVLAILVAQTGHGWGLYTLLTELPTYMKTVLHFDIKKNSILSALPYFVQWLVAISCSWYADYLRENNIATTRTVRKIFNTIAHWCPAALLIGAAYSGCDWLLTVILLTLAVGINGAAWASLQMNHIDISANNAAVIMGITNGFANLCGIGAPYIAGVIINEDASIERWKIVFFIAAAVYFFDNLFYLFFASGEEQSWNREKPTRRPTEYNRDSDDNDPLLPENV